MWRAGGARAWGRWVTAHRLSGSRSLGGGAGARRQHRGDGEHCQEAERQPCEAPNTRGKREPMDCPQRKPLQRRRAKTVSGRFAALAYPGHGHACPANWVRPNRPAQPRLRTDHRSR